MAIRVLLVDDEPALLDISRIFLERDTRFSIETAASGKIALELLENDFFDAIVSDYQMPEMDGLALLSRVREQENPIPFIILTGRGREEVVIEALNLGADFYLQKGGDPKSQFAELTSKIIHAVGERVAEEKARIAYAEMKKAVKTLEEQNRRLEESEAKFRNLANTTSTGILIHQDNRWIYVNPAAERMTGFTTEEICAMDFWELVAPEFREIVKERGQLREEGKEVENAYDFKILKKTGEEAWVHLMGSTTEYQGRLAVLISVIDITERKLMEDILRKQEENYRTLLNSLSDLILVIDGEDRFVGVHHNKGSLYVQQDNFLGKYFRDVLPPHIYEQYSVAANILRKTGEPQAYEYPLTIGDETKWFEALLNLREDGASIIAAIRDLTERKYTEDALRLANHKLSLLSRITRHDILNDVLTAKGSLELNEADHPENVSHYLSYVEEAITRIEREVEFTQEYQELGNFPPEWQVVRQVMEEGSQQMNIPMEIRVEIDVPSIEIFADQLLTLAVSNIFRNALVHAKDLTKISVSTHETPAGELCIAIQDDGTGVSIEKKKAILQPTYNRRYGHGLFLVRDILELTGISIRETGTPGKGARFELIVPVGRWRHFMEDTP